MLIDELGRASSTLDGASLGVAACEHLLLHAQCKTVFSTHAQHLLQVQSMYPLLTRVLVARKHNADDTNGGAAQFEIQCLESQAVLDFTYGIDVAAAAGFPDALVHEARELAHALRASAGPAASVHSALRSDILRRLCALSATTLDAQAIRAFVLRLRSSVG